MKILARALGAVKECFRMLRLAFETERGFRASMRHLEGPRPAAGPGMTEREANEAMRLLDLSTRAARLQYALELAERVRQADIARVQALPAPELRLALMGMQRGAETESYRLLMEDGTIQELPAGAVVYVEDPTGPLHPPAFLLEHATDEQLAAIPKADLVLLLRSEDPELRMVAIRVSSRVGRKEGSLV